MMLYIFTSRPLMIHCCFFDITCSVNQINHMVVGYLANISFNLLPDIYIHICVCIYWLQLGFSVVHSVSLPASRLLIYAWSRIGFVKMQDFFSYISGWLDNMGTQCREMLEIGFLHLFIWFELSVLGFSWTKRVYI